MSTPRSRALLGAILTLTLSACDSTSSTGPGGCKTDSECAGKAAGSVCDPGTKTCVECATDSTCGMGRHCDANKKCVQCAMQSHCPMGQVCTDGICRLGCDANAPCPAGQVCLNKACVQCATDADCAMAGGRCAPSSHTCVACLADNDCAAGKVCKANKCEDGCSTGQPCPMGKVCDTGSGACVACLKDGDCKDAAAPRCEARTNTCVACLPGNDNCKPGQYCANLICTDGCKGDSDCQAGNPSPASQGNPRCLLASNKCVACLGNGDCKQGTICAPDHTCSKGCASDNNCGQGEGCCAGQCVALNTQQNCGVCGTSCQMGEGCCFGQCVVLNSNSNCGGCGVSCGQGQACCNGACAPINTAQNCGACGVACNMGSGCCGQQCTALNTIANCGGCNLVCGVGQTCCGTCTNPLNDAKNCGACGMACPMGQICCAGQCKSPNAPGNCVDCGRTCNSYDVTGQNGWQGGKLDQVSIDGNGNLTTVPAMNNPPPATAPHVWIANHDSNQVTKLDVANGTLLGTFPSGGGNPSRGAMALDGTFWIGHRGQNCNVSDPNCSNVTNINLDGTIRCQVGKAADGQPLPFVRALAIDKDGFIWAGTWNDARLHKIDPVQCRTVADFPMVFMGQQSYPYGIAIDSKGILWNSSIGSGPWLAFDTNQGRFIATVPAAGASYGLTIDRRDNVYLAQWCSTGVWRIDGAMRTVSSIGAGPGGYCPRGMTTDTDGNVWAAMYNGGVSFVAKFTNGTGAFVGAYQQDVIHAAVAISGDPTGNVWLAGNFNQGGTAAVRFSRTINANNQRDLVTRMMGAYPYSYSDWTGIVLRTVTSNNAQAGTWVQAFDGQSPNTTWQTATWTANTPKGTAVKLRFAAATSFGGLKNAGLCGPFLTSPADLGTCNFGPKQWLAVTVELTTNDVNVQPTMSNLKIFYQN